MGGVLFQYFGKSVIVGLVALTFFILTYKNSLKLFEWIETQTFGTRDYLLSQFERLFFEVDPLKLTYTLLFLSFGVSLLVFGVCLLWGKVWLGLFLFALFFLIGWRLPKPLIDFMVRRRINLFSIQMVDGLGLLANGLRAGLSLPQAVGMVVEELPPPISQEFNLVLQQNRIGVPLDECFENLLKRVPTEDNQMFVTSINILRESGGNLAETFDTITFVIRERVRLKQKVDTFIAQGKFQGATIFAMPFVMLIITGVSDPDIVAPLFTTIPGILLLMVALALNLTGGFFMLKVIKIKV